MKQDNIITIAFIIALFFVAFSLIINTTKSCDVNINYNVTKDINSTSSDLSMAEIKLSCYKLCVEELASASSTMRDCLDKCEGLK
tara:strand:- start:742 stop:996 length:255 start_codon:yes stop_codon:yes gene_type:complete